jgi:nucleotide-binding universal stress UspA family protein
MPAVPEMVGNTALPMADYAYMQAEKNKELQRLATRLSEEKEIYAGPESFHPAIGYTSAIGDIVNVIQKTADEERINLTIMGMSGAGAFSKFMIGSQTRDLIEVTHGPLLLIPPNATFKPLLRIAFATDLNPDDIQLIHSLTGIARKFNAELLIVHVVPEGIDQVIRKSEIDSFLTDITDKVDYPRIYYRQVKNSAITKGLEWLSENAKIDMLAMSHTHRGFIGRLFKNSHAQNLARYTHIPLLVFPRKHRTLWAF